MRGVAGFSFFALGLGVAAYTCYPTISIREGLESGPEAETVTLVERPGGSGTTSRVFSPQSPLFSPVVNARLAEGPKKQLPALVDTPMPPPTSVPRGARSSRPASLEDRVDLIRALQSELKRVGCYEGEIDGSWGSGSKRAMSQFNDRVNASLPLSEPDYILLTLVQGQKSIVCGHTCPSGQILWDARCVPKAVLAQQTAKKTGKGMKSEPRAPTVIAEAIPPNLAPPSAGIGPFTTTVVPSVTAPIVTKPQTIARVDGLDEPSVPVTRTAPVVASQPPLPGRMAMGAPADVAGIAPPVPVTSEPPRPEAEGAPPAAATPRRPAAVRAPSPHRAAHAHPQRHASPGGGGAARQRALVYNLFMRPDRN